MKRLNIIKIVLLSINVLLLGIIFIALVKNNNVSFISHREKLIYENTFTDKVTNIAFDVTSFDIKIDYNEEENITIKAYSPNDDQLTLTIAGETMKVDLLEKSCVGFCFNNGNKYIEINVPKNMEYYFTIEGISSDINSNIPLKSIDINTKSGDISLKEVNVSSIKTISGDINIDNVLEKLKIETVSGDIYVKEMMLEEPSSIDTTSGDVIIKNINSTLLLDVSTVSGNKNINYSNGDSSIMLKIKTISGDILIN